MLGKPRILSLFPNSLINSIKHEHLCKILYVDDIGKDLNDIIDSNLTFRKHSSNGRHYGDRDLPVPIDAYPGKLE